MADRLGWRRKFGILGPSTNTVVEPDFNGMRPQGVTNHYSCIYTPNAKAISNETFMAGIVTIGANTLDAVRMVMTSAPDYLVMGMSAVTFFGGIAGADAFEASIRNESGLEVSIGSHAVAAALRALGGVRRIAFFSPYFPSANAEVTRYFTECGFEVVRQTCLRCPSWTAIAEVEDAQMRAALHEIYGPGDVDAVVQVGTNLSMVRLAAAAELWLGIPVVAINTATYWHALRKSGITDRMEGFGRLLQDH